MQYTAETREPAGSACSPELAPEAPCCRPRATLTRARQERGFLVCARGKEPGGAAHAAPENPERHAGEVNPVPRPECRVELLPAATSLPVAAAPFLRLRCRVRVRSNVKPRIEMLKSRQRQGFSQLDSKIIHKQYKLANPSFVPAFAGGHTPALQ